MSKAAERTPRSEDSTEIRVTVQKAAEATGLSVDTIRNLITRREITAKYPTTRPMVSVSELREWIESAPDRPPGGKP